MVINIRENYDFLPLFFWKKGQNNRNEQMFNVRHGFTIKSNVLINHASEEKIYLYVTDSHVK